MIVAGTLTYKMAKCTELLYDQMPDPRRTSSPWGAVRTATVCFNWPILFARESTGSFRWTSMCRAVRPGPHLLIEQLKIPGYLVFPMGEKELQILVRIRKDRAGIREEYLGDCHFVNLKGRYGWEDIG
jgi:hypothetical protein